MAVTLRDFISGDEVLTIESNATLGAAARQMWNRSVGAAVLLAVDTKGAIAAVAATD